MSDPEKKSKIHNATPPVIITIRYSLLEKGTTSFEISDGIDFDKYRQKLFDNKRLNVHYNLFFSLTIPSIAAQSSGLENFKLYIITSKSLPEFHKKKLYSVALASEWMEIIEYGENEPVNHNMLIKKYLDSIEYKGSFYAHARLDDDDAISINYLKNIRKYINKNFNNYVISFSKGIHAFYNEKNHFIDEIYEVQDPLIAIGLAVIGEKENISNIYDMGNHREIYRKIPCIVDGRNISYIRTKYLSQDTADSRKKRFKNKIRKLVGKKRKGYKFQLDNKDLGDNFGIDHIF